MNDAISRRAAIDAYILHTMDYLVEEKPRRAFTEVLRELPSAHQWIPCSERLPKESEHRDGMVLTCYADGAIRFDQYREGVHRGSWLYGNPVAWMPLPDPYKG